MLLTIDVGNTNIVFGLFEGATLAGKFRLGTDANHTADEIGLLTAQFFGHFGFRKEDVSHIILCSVVPYVMYTVNHAIRKYFDKEPILVGETAPIPLVNLCEEPLGVDRAVTAVGAMERYGKPLIVVDFGTATKADCLNDAGEYMGGVICPGIKISLEALFKRAAKLPHIEIRSAKRVIGVNTVEQMEAGAVYGYVGSIEHIVRCMKTEMGSGDIPVVATGGLGHLIARNSNIIDHVDSNLTLEGLRVIFEGLPV